MEKRQINGVSNNLKLAIALLTTSFENAKNNEEFSNCFPINKRSEILNEIEKVLHTWVAINLNNKENS